MIFATFLAPNMLATYRYIAEYVGQETGIRTELIVGSSFAQFEEGAADVGFLCGLPYVQLTRRRPPPVELLAAPVLHGARYGAQPVYFSEVIVRRESPVHSFADLRGRSWSYNDPDSHSGYNLTRYHLVRLGETGGFFGRVVEAGWHQESIQMVLTGRVDASAIDSHVLAIELRDHPELAGQLRVIETFGPSSIQPVVAARQLPGHLKGEIRAALLAMGDNPATREQLARGLIDRFVPVADARYDDIREMLAAAEAAGFMVIR